MCNDEIRVIGNGPPEDTSSKLFLDAILKETLHKGIKEKIKYYGIWDNNYRSSKFVTTFSNFGENKFIDGIPTKVTTVIFGDRLGYLFTIEGKPKVIEIQNQLIADENKAYFSHLWKIAKP